MLPMICSTWPTCGSQPGEVWVLAQTPMAVMSEQTVVFLDTIAVFMFSCYLSVMSRSTNLRQYSADAGEPALDSSYQPIWPDYFNEPGVCDFVFCDDHNIMLNGVRAEACRPTQTNVTY
jgi:hypothetical protein